MPSIFVINTKPNNWEMCRDKAIHGIRMGARLLDLQKGDICLIRVGGQGYGVRGVWAFESKVRIENQADVPWKDASYEWLLRFNPLIREFKTPFSENFEGKSKYSSKVKLNSIFLSPTMVLLKPQEAKNYLTPLLDEKREETNIEVEYLGHKVNLYETLKRMSDELVEKAESISEIRKPSKFKPGQIITHPIHGRIRILSANYKDGKWEYEVEKLL